MLFDIVDYYRSRTNSFYMLEGYLDRCGNRFKYVKVTGKGKSLHSNNLSHFLPQITTFRVLYRRDTHKLWINTSREIWLEKSANQIGLSYIAFHVHCPLSI